MGGDRDVLAEAALAGSADGITQLLERLAGELLPFASALTGGTGEADALVGDTLSRVHERTVAAQPDSGNFPPQYVR